MSQDAKKNIRIVNCCNVSIPERGYFFEKAQCDLTIVNTSIVHDIGIMQ
ncbi:MAG: hypothetical protein HRU06_07120 [Oceanospirillaceae bacterium]|nr:hypothetical protein [Oceanospirillaceae bacterium]